MPRVRCGCRRGDLHTAAGALPQSLVRMRGLRGPHPLGHGRRARPLGARSRNKVTRNPETLLPLTSRPMLRFRQNPGGVFYVRQLPPRPYLHRPLGGRLFRPSRRHRRPDGLRGLDQVRAGHRRDPAGPRLVAAHRLPSARQQGLHAFRDAGHGRGHVQARVLGPAASGRHAVPARLRPVRRRRQQWLCPVRQAGPARLQRLCGPLRREDRGGRHPGAPDAGLAGL